MGDEVTPAITNLYLAGTANSSDPENGAMSQAGPWSPKDEAPQSRWSNGLLADSTTWSR
jgi:hypothetical protein